MLRRALHRQRVFVQQNVDLLIVVRLIVVKSDRGSVRSKLRGERSFILRMLDRYLVLVPKQRSEGFLFGISLRFGGTIPRKGLRGLCFVRSLPQHRVPLYRSPRIKYGCTVIRRDFIPPSARVIVTTRLMQVFDFRHLAPTLLNNDSSWPHLTVLTFYPVVQHRIGFCRGGGVRGEVC